MSAQMTGEEMFESLTGFEEIAVSTAFGGEIADLASTKPTMFLRAMVFVHQTREGLTAKEAKDRAMNMTLKDANGYFQETEDELMPEEPVTEQGKDDSPRELRPRSKRASAS